ncbi:hypothetical protein [Streptomyces sulfonofaciens]|uniref:hypothetical protein n=1 Tax=Streptomyces sulfonofaciens TaxID=68272 RepID=UPI0016746D28|nr:hypothetical protein [Streptomyces sulfonofaciens]
MDPYRLFGGQVEWEQVSASAFTFDLFRAAVSFIVNGINFGVDEPNQTLVDYCLMLNLGCRELQAHRGSQIQSSTGSFRMYFIRDSKGLRIASDRVEESALISVLEYHNSVSALLDSATGEILSTHPGLEGNPFLRRVARIRCWGMHGS